MREKDKPKTVLGYIGGAAVLAAAVAAAWFFPGWYSSLQDRFLIEKVVLGSRDRLQFIDTKSLDIAGRMRMLEDVEEIMPWEIGESLDYAALGQMGVEEEITRCEALMEQWREAGLLPLDEAGTKIERWRNAEGEEYPGFYDEGYDAAMGYVYLYLDEGVLPLIVIKTWNPTRTIVMDRDQDLIYYMSVSGSSVWDGMAAYLGYDSYWELAELYKSGSLREEDIADVSEPDFASVCGALSARTGRTDESLRLENGGLNLDAALEYDTFEGKACRRLMCMDNGYGMAAMLGTPHWIETISSMMASSGYYECPGSFGEWMENPEWMPGEVVDMTETKK